MSIADSLVSIKIFAESIVVWQSSLLTKFFECFIGINDATKNENKSARSTFIVKVAFHKYTLLSS
jgi:hypothetical protein